MSLFEQILGITVVIIVCAAFLIIMLIAIRLVTNWQMAGNNPLKKYHRNKDGAKLSQTEQRAINVGAILTEFNHEYCDSLQSVKQSATKHLKRTLAAGWGIDSAEKAEKALERLKSKTQSRMFSLILSDAAKSQEGEPSFEEFLLLCGRADLPIIDAEIVKEYDREAELAEKHIDKLHALHIAASEEERNRLIEKDKALFGDADTYRLCIQIYRTVSNKYNDYLRHSKNLKKTWEILRKHGFVGERSELTRIDPTAWDMGRMVNVARWSYTCGYLPESKAWEFIFLAEKESSACYVDWAAFSNAYIIGRALWGNEDDQLDIMISAAKGLLSDEASPWKSMPLNN
jgi:hypothetical protein